MKTPKTILLLLLALALAAAGVVSLVVFRYKTIEVTAGNERVKVKIDRWTGTRYRTLYRFDIAEAASRLPAQTALSFPAAQPTSENEPADSSRTTAAVVPQLPPAVPAPTEGASSPASPPRQETVQPPPPKESERIAVKSPPKEEPTAREATQNCGFPVTNSELLNVALRTWCTQRQSARYQRLSQQERTELRSRIWEDACRKSSFASSWSALPFEVRKELSQLYFKTATF